MLPLDLLEITICRYRCQNAIPLFNRRAYSQPTVTRPYAPSNTEHRRHRTVARHINRPLPAQATKIKKTTQSKPGRGNDNLSTRDAYRNKTEDAQYFGGADGFNAPRMPSRSGSHTIKNPWVLADGVSPEVFNFHRRSDTTSEGEFVDARVAIPPDAPPHTAGALSLDSNYSLSFTKFSPPLLPGFITSLSEVLGKDAVPTPIQALSLDHFFKKGKSHRRTSGSSETLLAAETGSGKSIAYLLPVLQNLRETDLPPSSRRDLSVSPRALILAPTHELCRQLSATVKKLTHVEKLNTLCLSTPPPRQTSANWDRAFEMAYSPGAADSELKRFHPDIMVGTPAAMLETFKVGDEVEEQLDDGGNVVVKRDHGTTKGLDSVEWVVIDEADVLLDQDFRPAVRNLLHYIREARLGSRATTASPKVLEETNELAAPSVAPDAKPPFNLLLSTATVSSSLSAYLSERHPNVVRLLSPQLHHLPSSLKTEHVAWSGGNRDADVAEYIIKARVEEARRRLSEGLSAAGGRSRFVVFCNSSSKVEHLTEYLNSRSIASIGLTSQSEERKKGSNSHLDGFIVSPRKGDTALSSAGDAPHVLITTSLLSRGLDFSPSVGHVLIVDEPKNMVDFLHRAGRSGRAGREGKVVIFSKERGRGNYLDEVKNRIKAIEVKEGAKSGEGKDPVKPRVDKGQVRAVA